MTNNNDLEKRIECLEVGHDVHWSWKIRRYRYGDKYLEVKCSCVRCGAEGKSHGGKRLVKAITLLDEFVQDIELRRIKCKST